MKRRFILLARLGVLSTLLLAACAGQATPTPAPTSAAPRASQSIPLAEPEIAVLGFESKSDSAGSVAVNVKPTALALGRSISFDIAMNTHSVDLSDDMVRASLLRDDTGKEYTPTEWDGSGPGGHHRSGTLVFGALTGKPKFVELVIRGVARVPERVFHWDLTQ